MRAKLTATFLKSAAAQPQARPFEVRDTEILGYLLRVQPSGARSYIAQIGRGRRVTLGSAGHLTPDQARERAKLVFGNVAHNREPFANVDGADRLTLGAFVDPTYAAFLKANRPRGAKLTLQRLQTCFGKWYGDDLAAITVERLEQWRIDRFKEGRKPTTVLRDLMVLSGVLTQAVKQDKLAHNVVKKIVLPRIDRTPKPRYLSEAENKRLRDALAARDRELIRDRESGNKWRRERKQPELPSLPFYGDHLSPLVIVARNTGMRKGELLALRWNAIDFKQAHLTVEGDTAKSGQTRQIRLNAEALTALKQWEKQKPLNSERVFGVADNVAKSWAALLKRANIARFRFHDLRHDFASRLVQLSVPLNTVRVLLGHASLAMTLRYAGLGSEQERNAVDKLVSK